MAAIVETLPMPATGVDPSADMKPLRSVLAPRSIAVIGAARTPNHIGHQVLANLVRFGFTGPVYPVNPRASSVGSIRAYPRVDALPEAVDLAVVAVPKEQVVEVADECGAAGVRSLAVISAGFREVGGAGAARERDLLATVRRHGVRMVGPNCMGVINTSPDVSMNATFAPLMPPRGGAAFVSQSGALGLSVLDYASEYGIGICQFVSVGNKADVSGNDLLLAWEQDETVDVILMYVENFGNPRRFLEIASRITRRKPIIVVKSGRSRAGARAASSHTGALASSDVAVDALLAQAGVLRAGSIEELFDMAMAFGVCAPPRSRRAAVLTNAGGPGILAADALEAQGIDLVELSPETVAKLAPLFPPEASVRNPLDMIASATPSGYRAALTALLEDRRVDTVVPIFVPPFGVRQEDVAEAIVAAAREHGDKPLLAVLMGREGLPAGRAELQAAGIPAYVFPESAARALAALHRHREWAAAPPACDEPLPVNRETAAAILDAVRGDGREWLSELEALSLLVAYGIAVAPVRVATGAHAAARAARELGFPVALKILSPDLTHKSDVGGVVLDVRTASQAHDAHERIVQQVQERAPAARIDGVLVQRMVAMDGARETIAGISRDREFGALVMFGLGGVFVEALRDVTFRIAPLDERQARALVDGIRGAPLLDAFRGQPPVDRSALVDVLRRVGQLAIDFPRIQELDINPLVAHGEGVIAVDVRVRIGD